MLCVFFTEFNTDDSSSCRGKMYVPWYTQVLRTPSDASDRCSQLCDPAPVNAQVPASIQTGTFPLAGSHIYSTLGRLQGSTKERLEFKSHPQSLFAIHMDFKKVTENGIQKLFWCKKISEIYASGFFSNTFSIQLLKFPHFLSIYIYVCMYICVCLSSIFSATNKR